MSWEGVGKGRGRGKGGVSISCGAGRTGTLSGLVAQNRGLSTGCHLTLCRYSRKT